LALLVKNHMATIHQIDANRRNALKSTGPKTPEGKAAVRMNSLRHGLRARTVVLPGENREEFNQLCDDLEREWTPQSRTAKFYLEQMAVSQWKLTRMEVAEAGIFKEALSAKVQLPLLDRLWQAQCRLERSYARAQRELERLQAYRPRKFQEGRHEPAPQPAPEPPEDVPAAAAPPAASKPQPAPRAPEVIATPVANAAPPTVAPSPRVESARPAAP
jgi:hypothetical protein